MAEVRFSDRAAAVVVAVFLVATAVWLVPQLRGVRVNEGEAASVPDPGEVYDPVRAGEPLPAGFRQLLPRDAIAPIYAPRYVPASEAGWSEDTTVLGVAINGEARAYPIRTLDHREMVIERIGGVPLLATW